MGSTDKITPFKTPFDAYEHCRIEMDTWHPKWQAALKAGNVEVLRGLAERFRHRVLSVFPKAQYSGSWASANANFAYRLSELSEFEHPLEHMTEARSLYGEALPSAAPEWHKSMWASYQHSYAEILLRFADVSGNAQPLDQARAICEQVSTHHDSERRRALTTLGAILRRIAERNLAAATCKAALDALKRADIDQDPATGDLSWALQRTTLAAVLLLKHQVSPGQDDLVTAHRSVQQALSNYRLNPHQFWIRPSWIEDSVSTNAKIEQLIWIE